jgi:NAD(P)H-hydrate epimerase
VLALDLPTGVDADTGAATDPAVRAAVTVMFIGRKLGLYTGAGVAFAGRREFAGLGVAKPVYRQVPGCPLLDYAGLGSECRLPPRDPGAYKQSFGHVAVIGGDFGMGGAPLMAAEAALRVGAGLVSVITRAAHRPAILARRPEVMVVEADDAFARAAVLQRATCLVVGPGLGREPWGEALLGEALALGKPTVLDADGLHGLAVRGLVPNGPVIGTPHPGEAGALLGVGSADIQADRPAAARALAERLRGVAVLKGPGTLVAALGSGGTAALHGVCSHGNPGMASAGMGDVLAGVIGGLVAQGLAPAGAAVAGTCLHSLAADRAAARLGQRSLLATDLIGEIIALLAAEEAGTLPRAIRSETRGPGTIGA